jgi:starch synthase
MEILFVSPEVVPFSKVGGLGDVVGALPKALRALGHKVTVLSLRYGSIDPAEHALARRLVKVKVHLAGETVDAEVYEARLPSGVTVVLLGGARVSDRPGIYGEGATTYEDNHLRFGLLCRGALAWMRMQAKVPDLVHLHDWTTGLLPMLIKHAAKDDHRFAKVRTVFTIHNAAHQGLFPLSTLTDLGLTAAETAHAEFYGQASWLKAGIVDSDRVTTVSPTYAREIVTPAGGAHMDGVLRAHATDLVGILNGLDPGVWNPSTDPHLVSRYDVVDPLPKVRCKSALQKALGLAPRPETPVLGMVARIDAQKGLDLLLGCATQLLRQDVQLVVQGSGDPDLVAALTALAREMPEKVAYRTEFDDGLAHRIFAGSDLFLVPSRFEPSGLTQLYAMRYGSVPVVRNTGGLRDTVVDCDNTLGTGTGFVFDDLTPDAFYGAIARGLAAYAQPERFAALRRRVMRLDHAWDRSARRYAAIYRELLPLVDDNPSASA